MKAHMLLDGRIEFSKACAAVRCAMEDLSLDPCSYLRDEVCIMAKDLSSKGTDLGILQRLEPLLFLAMYGPWARSLRTATACIKAAHTARVAPY